MKKILTGFLAFLAAAFPSVTVTVPAAILAGAGVLLLTLGVDGAFAETVG